MVSTFTLRVIRHARTAGNIAKCYVGWTDEPIVDTPLPTIDTAVKSVYGSDLQRCEQTAKSYFPQAIFTAIPQLREMHFGDFEMHTYEQLKACQAYRQWIDHALVKHPPNGERFSDFQQRVLAGIQQIPFSEQADCVLHGGTIRILLMTYAPQPSAFWDWQIAHDEQYILHFASYRAFKEGQRCISLSVERIMAN